MKSLSTRTRTGLKVAACLGTTFNEKVWKKVKRDYDIEDSFLQSCLDFGFMQVVGPDEYVWGEPPSRMWRDYRPFVLTDLVVLAHDQIQRAAYDLIPTRRQESFHLLVGTRLFVQTLPSEMENMLFIIVDNMNRGSSLINDPEQKWEMAQLNLEAGEKALKEAAFLSAAKYLLAGISFLGPDSWELKYNLSLNLHDAGMSVWYKLMPPMRGNY